MQVEVLVAVISGAAGVTGAIVAWMQANRTNELRARVDLSLEQMKSEAALALENLKIQNERRRRAFEEASQTSAPIEASLDQAWHDIQTVKEVIARLLAPSRYDKDIALKDLQPAVLRIENGYKKYGASVPEKARGAWHNAKKCTALVELVVDKEVDTDPPSTPVAETLQRLRRDLTDQQMALIAAREGLRGTLMKNILSLL